jgi:hypothetical protein
MASGIDAPVTADQPPEPPIPAQVAPAPARRPEGQGGSGAEVSVSVRAAYRPWILLDPFTARHARSFSFALLESRLLDQRAASRGYSFSFGENLTTLRGAFAAGALQEHELRLVPDDALSLNLSRYQWEGGPRFGIVEPTARVGFTLLHVDVGSAGFSMGALSPRAGLGLWLAFPTARIGVSAFTEYFWRWLGSESAFVHGLTFELQPRAEPLRKPRSTSSPSAPTRR